MELYNDLEIIQGIRRKDNKILEYIYDEYFGMIYEFVSQNNGSDDDTRDVLQEAIVFIYNKINNESLELSSSFKTYLYSICRYIWYNEVRRRQREFNNIMDYAQHDRVHSDSLQFEYKHQQRYRLYQEHFSKLGKECRKVLRMFLMDCSYEHIAKVMNYKNIETAKRKKYVCKNQLVKSIKKDKRFKDLS